MIKREGEWWMQSMAIGEDDGSFDLAFWQAQGPDAIFRAAWELVEEAWKLKGGDPMDLKLDRTALQICPIEQT